MNRNDFKALWNLLWEWKGNWLGFIRMFHKCVLFDGYLFISLHSTKCLTNESCKSNENEFFSISEGCRRAILFICFAKVYWAYLTSLETAHLNENKTTQIICDNGHFVNSPSLVNHSVNNNFNYNVELE